MLEISATTKFQISRQWYFFLEYYLYGVYEELITISIGLQKSEIIYSISNVTILQLHLICNSGADRAEKADLD
jgi:hypothetical protein